MVKSDKMPKNSAAGGIYGGFTASKIRRLIRRAVIFPAANSAIGGGWGVYYGDADRGCSNVKFQITRTNNRLYSPLRVVTKK